MKKLLYLGIILMFASCGSDAIDSTASNESESAEGNTPDVKVCYADAYAFAEKQIAGAGQRLISANVTKNDGSYLYYFMSAPLDMSNYCIMVISEHKLEIISTDCGDPYDKQEQWKNIQWYDDPCKESTEYDKDAVLNFGGLEIMIEELSAGNWHGAAEWCEDFGDGWRLPTKDELNILYENKENIAGLRNENGTSNRLEGVYDIYVYWSSTEVDETYRDNHPDEEDCNLNASGYSAVWVLSPHDGRFYCSDKYYGGYALPVRGNYNPAL